MAEPGTHKPEQLKGIVEADETFFRESFKGKRDGMTRPAYKRGTPASKRGLSAEQIPVLASDCILCTDSSKAMGAAARKIGITHRTVNLAAGIRVVARVYHVQNVNAYDSRLKNWMHRFHGVATRYLPSYLGWRRILDVTKETLTLTDILRAVLGLWMYQQLTRT